jgi:polyisoprenoid-binding protein YceI
MKKIILSSAFALATVVLFSFNTPTSTKQVETFTVTAQKSKVDFTGSKKNDFHTGYFPVKSGAVKIEAGKLVGGTFVVDVAGMKVTDAAGDKLAGHLSSADFFDVSKFGEATFNIISVKYTTADKATLSGSVTLRGITKEISFDANIRSADEKGFFAEAFFPFDRTLFGMNYGVGAIDSQVQLAVHIYASK